MQLKEVKELNWFWQGVIVTVAGSIVLGALAIVWGAAQAAISSEPLKVVVEVFPIHPRPRQTMTGSPPPSSTNLPPPSIAEAGEGTPPGWCYIATVANAGNTAITNVELRLPGADTFQIGLDSKKSVLLEPNTPIRLGDVNPSATLQVIAWSASPDAALHQSSVIANHAGGTGEIEMHVPQRYQESTFDWASALVAFLAGAATVGMLETTIASRFQRQLDRDVDEFASRLESIKQEFAAWHESFARNSRPGEASDITPPSPPV